MHPRYLRVRCQQSNGIKSAENPFWNIEWQATLIIRAANTHHPAEFTCPTWSSCFEFKDVVVNPNVELKRDNFHQHDHIGGPAKFSWEFKPVHEVAFCTLFFSIKVFRKHFLMTKRFECTIEYYSQ